MRNSSNLQKQTKAFFLARQDTQKERSHYSYLDYKSQELRMFPRDG